MSATAAQQRYQMIVNQLLPGEVLDIEILNAMNSIPKEQFVPEALAGVAYADDHLEIDKGRYALAPLAQTRLFVEAELGCKQRVLIVGAGLGYGAAVASKLVQKVYALEENKTLSTQAKANLSQCGIHNVEVVETHLTDGHGFAAPYDVVLIEGGVAKLPEKILAQVKEGGRVLWFKQKTLRPSEAEGLATLMRTVNHGGSFSHEALAECSAPGLPGLSETPAGFIL